MFSPADEFDPHEDAGEGIAEDRRARLLRRFAWPAAALAVAGLIVLANGCERKAESIDPEPLSDAAPEPLPERGPGPSIDNLPLVGWDSFTGDRMTTDRDKRRVRLDGRGYFYSPTEHGPDFTVAYEYRFPEAAEMPGAERATCNTGCLLFITGEDEIWPRCLEVQGRWDDTAQIKSNARDVQVTSTLDEPARDAARKPPGEWNRVQIVSDGGALTVSLNGEQVSTSEPTELTRGRIGFQAEGFPVEFRNVTIAE